MKISAGKVCGIAAALLLTVQASPAFELSAGGRLGMNVSGIIGDTVKMMTVRAGINASVFASEWLTETFGLQQEVGIGLKGGSWKNSVSAGNQNTAGYPVRFTYLDIPILAKWKFLKNDMVRPVLFGGAAISFPLVAEAVYMGGNTSDQMSKTRPYDAGLAGGLSVEIKRRNAVIPIDIRYTFGLTDFLKHDAPDAYGVKLHHSAVSISAGVGWIFDFSKKNEF
jgi:hypothetical protein